MCLGSANYKLRTSAPPPLSHKSTVPKKETWKFHLTKVLKRLFSEYHSAHPEQTISVVTLSLSRKNTCNSFWQF